MEPGTITLELIDSSLDYQQVTGMSKGCKLRYSVEYNILSSACSQVSVTNIISMCINVVQLR